MSGFFGILRTDGAAIDRELLDRVARSLEFRGLDGTTSWNKQNAGCCFTFLETATLRQARVQPVTLDQLTWAIGEVRLDARRDLIAELQQKGRQVEENATDQELLLHAWSLWGEGALPRILGDFSFGIWDARSRSLTCARDFAGARPFYYAQGPGVFCFSNTLQVLPRVPGISSELDPLFLHDFLLDGQCRDAERTTWRSVRRLPPGHCLQLANGKLGVRRFLQLPVEEPLRFQRPEEYLENFRELLAQAVTARLPQGKASLYLSGGLDSASVCALAARVSSRELKAFTVSWRPLMDDPEPEFATQTARHLGLAHEIVEEAEFSPPSGGLEAPPEPSAEHLLGPNDCFYRWVAAHARVVLSGDGGDNVLDGQSWPYLKYLWSRGDWLEIARSFGAYSVGHGKFPALHGGFRARLRGWFRLHEEHEQSPAWLNPEFASLAQKEWEARPGPGESLPEHPLHPQAYRGLHSGFWGGVLEEEDAGWTRVLLETRAPFLDVRLLKFLLRLPPVPWCIHKELTRQAMRPLLPVEILTRPKTPLVEDPLQVCQQKAAWTPAIPKIPPKEVSVFVEWNPWLATLENSKGLLTWENLYPLALAYWFKAIENSGGIQ